MKKEDGSFYLRIAPVGGRSAIQGQPGPIAEMNLVRFFTDGGHPIHLELSVRDHRVFLDYYVTTKYIQPGKIRIQYRISVDAPFNFERKEILTLWLDEKTGAVTQAEGPQLIGKDAFLNQALPAYFRETFKEKAFDSSNPEISSRLPTLTEGGISEINEAITLYAIDRYDERHVPALDNITIKLPNGQAVKFSRYFWINKNSSLHGYGINGAFRHRLVEESVDRLRIVPTGIRLAKEEILRAIRRGPWTLEALEALERALSGDASGFEPAGPETERIRQAFDGAEWSTIKTLLGSLDSQRRMGSPTASEQEEVFIAIEKQKMVLMVAQERSQPPAGALADARMAQKEEGGKGFRSAIQGQPGPISVKDSRRAEINLVRFFLDGVHPIHLELSFGDHRVSLDYHTALRHIRSGEIAIQYRILVDGRFQLKESLTLWLDEKTRTVTRTEGPEFIGKDAFLNQALPAYFRETFKEKAFDSSNPELFSRIRTLAEGEIGTIDAAITRQANELYGAGYVSDFQNNKRPAGALENITIDLPGGKTVNFFSYFRRRKKSPQADGEHWSIGEYWLDVTSRYQLQEVSRFELSLRVAPTGNRSASEVVMRKTTASSAAFLKHPSNPNEAVTFIVRVHEATKQTGKLMLGSLSLDYQENRNGSLTIRGLGKGARTVNPGQWKKTSFADGQSGFEITFSMPDFKQALDRSNSAVEGASAGKALEEAQNRVKAVVVVDLQGLDPAVRGFDEVVVPLLVEEMGLARRRPWGRKAKFLLKGGEALTQRISSQIPEGQRNAIVTKEEDLGVEYVDAPRVLVTTPGRDEKGMRHFFIQSIQEGDIPNFRGGLKGALFLARVGELKTTNKDFSEVMHLIGRLLGHEITDASEYIQVTENPDLVPAETIRRRYSLPAVTRLPLDRIVQAVHLMIQMIRQSV
ncbi:MAG: hypothetical protein HYT89_00005 [Candidatus Omnitrophica bacterium]|nr:hypothetical protein [Candidatus Omnitrophota bacterium]